MPLPQENKKCPKCGAENPSDKGYLGECLCPCHQPTPLDTGKVEDWRNQEPWISIEGALWDVSNGVMGVLEAKNAIRKYLVDNQLTIENRKVDNWEKEWKTARIRHFSQNTGEFPEIDGVLWVASDDVKSFIKSLLSSHTEKLRKEIEGMVDLGALAAGTHDAEIHNIGWENCKYHILALPILNNEEVKNEPHN